MSSILIQMTYFSVYTICISEHYRAIVSYIPTPIQQVSAIFWNITITVWLKSQVHRVNSFSSLMHEMIKSQNTETYYTVIIFFLLGARFWTTGSFKVLANCHCILHSDIVLLSKQHNISKGKWDILEILILMFNFSFFCWTFVTRFFIRKFVVYTA